MHGTMDENVHFMQHTAQLINLLIKHGKPYQLQVKQELLKVVRNAGLAHSRNTWKLSPIYFLIIELNEWIN